MAAKQVIDLNCDLGEDPSDTGAERDLQLMKWISSANIACGFHAGDQATMIRAIQMALQNGVAIGAHPSYDDRNNFGQVVMDLSPDEVEDVVRRQLETFSELVNAQGAVLTHVKPHGALYNQAAKDGEIANAVAKTVREFSSELLLYGLSGSELICAGRRHGLRVVQEVFADRRYQRNGRLLSRSQPGAVIKRSDDALLQVRRMLLEGVVQTACEYTIPIQADTICVHGDGEDAASLAQGIGYLCEQLQVVVRPIE